MALLGKKRLCMIWYDALNKKVSLASMSIRFEIIVQSDPEHEIARDHERHTEKHICSIQIMLNSVFDLKFS